MNRIRLQGIAVALLLTIIALPLATAAAQTTPAPGPAVTSAPAAYLGAVSNATVGGASIAQVLSGSPAEKAGLLTGDLIESVNGADVTLDSPLSSLLSRYSPGARLQLVIGRGSAGAWQVITVTLGSRPDAISPIAAPALNSPAPISLTPAGAVTRSNAGFLGIGLINNGNGLQIARIAAGSPAQQAGLQLGDVLVSLDGQPLNSISQVQALLAARTPGTPVSIGLTRATQSLTVTAVLSNTPRLSPTAASITISPNGTPQGAQSDSAPTVNPGAGVHLGVTYDVITPALASARQLPVTDGALIDSIEPGSPAAAAGMQVGDIVTAVDGDKVDVRHTLAVRLVAYGSGDTFSLTVIRAGQTISLMVTLTTRGSA